MVGVPCHTQSSCSGGPCMSQRNEEPWKAVRPYLPRPPMWAGWVEYPWYQVQKSRSRDSWVQWTKQEVVLASCASTHLLFQTQSRFFSVSALSLGMSRTSSSCDHDLLLSSPLLAQGTSERLWVWVSEAWWEVETTRPTSWPWFSLFIMSPPTTTLYCSSP